MSRRSRITIGESLDLIAKRAAGAKLTDLSKEHGIGVSTASSICQKKEKTKDYAAKNPHNKMKKSMKEGRFPR